MCGPDGESRNVFALPVSFVSSREIFLLFFNQSVIPRQVSGPTYNRVHCGDSHLIIEFINICFQFLQSRSSHLDQSFASFGQIDHAQRLKFAVGMVLLSTLDGDAIGPAAFTAPKTNSARSFEPAELPITRTELVLLELAGRIVRKTGHSGAGSLAGFKDALGGSGEATVAGNQYAGRAGNRAVLHPTAKSNQPPFPRPPVRPTAVSGGSRQKQIPSSQ